jgi:hypothetical protein
MGLVMAHELVIRLGRPFDIQIRGEFRDTTEITIPFADRESAEAAQREVSLFVRAVHDAGVEDYRPVVAGEVVPEDFERAVTEQTVRMRASIIAPKPDLGDVRGDLARDMRDLRELGEINMIIPLSTRCPACGISDDVPMDNAPLPETNDEALSYCTTCGRRMDQPTV